jgi:uncharacterized membrane protein
MNTALMPWWGWIVVVGFLALVALALLWILLWTVREADRRELRRQDEWREDQRAARVDRMRRAHQEQITIHRRPGRATHHQEATCVRPR